MHLIRKCSKSSNISFSLQVFNYIPPDVPASLCEWDLMIEIALKYRTDKSKQCAEDVSDMK